MVARASATGRPLQRGVQEERRRFAAAQCGFREPTGGPMQGIVALAHDGAGDNGENAPDQLAVTDDGDGRDR